MKQRRHYASHRLNRDGERLVWLAKGLADSGSRVEDGWWEGELSALIDKLLAANREETINQALDRLHETHIRAYDELADLIEAGVEGQRLDTAEAAVQVLLLALPVLASSRYNIPARPLSAQILANLRVQMQAHVLAGGARLGLADFLFSPDQLPYGYLETRRLLTDLGRAALAATDLHLPPESLPETGQYISDVRYVLAAVATPLGRPLFRWNEVDGERAMAEARWVEQAGPSLQSALPGCAIQPLLPDAFFSAWRRADREARPHALTASVTYLQGQLGLPAASLRAVVAPYYEHRLVEWRVSFATAEQEAVVHGVVWPLLGTEDETQDVGGEIERLLKQSGLTSVIVLDQRMPLEYCDDCGAPLFPNADGESVHAEMPEIEGEAPPRHLH